MTRSHLIGVLRGALLFLGLGMDAVRPSAAPVPSAPAPLHQVKVQEITAYSAETLLSRGLHPVALGALPAGIASPSVTECEGCHVREAAEWGTSLHRRSFTQPLFQEAYRQEPMAECDNCHQPLTAGQKPSRAVLSLRREGITCAVCHVRDGQILAARPSGRAPHQVAEAKVLAEPAFCGGCHQFPFPDRRGDGLVHHTKEPMQDTLGEWERQAHGGGDKQAQTCQDCHMPWQRDGAGRPRRSHRFLGGYDGESLRRAVAVRGEVKKDGAGLALHLHLFTKDVGHAVPTGDLYRSLLIEAELVDGRGRRLAGSRPQVRKLMRHFRSVVVPDEGGVLRVRRIQTEDERLFPGVEREVVFSFPRRALEEPIALRYRLSLHRLPPGQHSGGAAALSPIKEGLIPLAQGETS